MDDNPLDHSKTPAIDDKPLDIEKQSTSFNTESPLIPTEKQEESVEEKKGLTTNRSRSYYEKEFSESVNKSTISVEQQGMKSSFSSLTSKRHDTPKHGEKIPESCVMMKKRMSENPASNSGAERYESLDSTSDADNEHKSGILADPSCCEKAPGKCISPRPSTSAGASCSNDYGRIRGNFKERNEKLKYVCEYCGKVCTRKSVYETHLRTHTGERPFECEHCKRRFKTKSNLKIHTLCHTGERPFVCKECGMSFNRADSLRVHKRTHTGEKSYECDYCDRRFTTKQRLNDHIRRHTGECPFVCKECGRSFRRADYLKVHKRAHTGERPHKCDICGEDFGHRITLIRHEKVHEENSEA